ncbi:mercury resistance system transport protein MerF [Candidatus Spongiihabitans sp.]|uniref:mercury resistance system transport protein MerF n=1 Tax=Candidatus Spongiihabitans sp. TaxID=3101308 RepID=UPI003C6F2B65
MNQIKSKQSGLLKTGIIGSIIVALCCFTPILVVLLGGLGLFAVVGYLDFALYPALAFFIGMTIFSLWTQSKT